MSSSQRLLSRSDIRSLPTKLEKAVALHLNYNVSLRNASSLLGIGYKSVHRGVVAKRSGRDIGVTGRPPFFRKNQSMLLSKFWMNLKETESQWNLIVSKIWYFSLSFFLFFSFDLVTSLMTSGWQKTLKISLLHVLLFRNPT